MNNNDIENVIDFIFSDGYKEITTVNDFLKKIEEKDKEIERLNSIIEEVREYIENKEFINYKKNLGNFERMLKHRQELLEILDKVEENK